MTVDYVPSTPHLRDSLQHDPQSTKSDSAPTVVTSDANGFAAVMIFCSDPQEANNRFIEAYRHFQLVSADANNDASARMRKIEARASALEIREKEVADLKALLDQKLVALKELTAL